MVLNSIIMVYGIILFAACITACCYGFICKDRWNFEQKTKVDNSGTPVVEGIEHLEIICK